MWKWIGLGTFVLLAACDAPQATVVTGPDGQPSIQINPSGLTCYDRRCLDINPQARTVQGVGFKKIGIPGSIDVSDGTLTPDEFKQLSVAASLAGGPGSGNR